MVLGALYQEDAVWSLPGAPLTDAALGRRAREGGGDPEISQSVWVGNAPERALIPDQERQKIPL